MNSKFAELSNQIRNEFPATKNSLSRRKPILNVGINDADYIVNPVVNGERLYCPAYRSWKSIIERCHSKIRLGIRPTYAGASVCYDWLSFSKFRCWYIKNYVDGWRIDKDILSCSKVYSPDTCIFVPSWINSLPTDSLAVRGSHPIGVRVRDGKFVARVNVGNGKQEELGRFDDQEDAHKAWLSAKIGYINSRKQEMDDIDIRIHKGLIRIVSSQR